MTERKYLPSLAELIDRLSIVQLKEVFIPEHKHEYAREIKDIVHDIGIELFKGEVHRSGEDNDDLAQLVRAVIVLAQMNLHIWHNESEVRAGTGKGSLELTHGLNGIRNTAKNVISSILGGRKDYKTDCLAAEFSDWEISW